jgi:Uma2 family endonuclease
MPAKEISKVKELRWTVGEYDQMQAAGYFGDRRVELMDGRIIEMSAQLEPHVAGVSLSAKALERAFGDKYWVRRQNPLTLGKRWKPEPDVAVVPGNENDYIDIGNPQSAFLVIEVSDSSLTYDRGRKASAYARHGITDYWIINLVDRQVEIHRGPILDALHRFKFRYERIQVLKSGQSIAPLALDVPVDIANLLPRLPCL